MTFAKNYGKLTDVYDGVDLTVNARLPRGALVQGGVNIGREVTDMCDVVGKVDAPAAAGSLRVPRSRGEHRTISEPFRPGRRRARSSATSRRRS